MLPLRRPFTRVLARILSSASVLSLAAAAQAQTFQDCGTFVQTQYCSTLLFEADSGGHFVIDPPPPGVVAGQRARVDGNRFPGCITICYQECIVGAVTSPCDVPVGTAYCTPALPNSSGAAGTITALGSRFIAANDVRLVAERMPPGQFGYFLASRTQAAVNPPGSSGVLCLGGNVGRYAAPGQIVQGPTGSLALDLGAIPVNPPRAVAPGETWSFQCWFRDVPATSNFSDGVQIDFQ